MLKFDEALLKKRLSQTEPKRRVLFTAITSTRVLPAYNIFKDKTNRGNPFEASKAIDFIWESFYAPSDRRQWSNEVNLLINNLMGMIPREDESWIPLCDQADDALSAVIYSLRCLLNPLPQEAAWAVRRVYETVDNVIINQIEGTTIGERKEEAILSHRMMQQELKQEAEDIKTAETTSFEQQNLREIRLLSQQNGLIFFQRLLNAE